MVTVVTPPTGQRTACRKCGAGLSYMPNEVQRGVHHDYGGGADHYSFIICPCCGHQITVRG